ncbi:MAG: hypothetical protein WAL56_21875 [Candidatus Sulfotelmatobacter sp.]
MKATPWITYRTRFLVKANQLTSSLTFTDALGRQHSGRKGDYLVESSDGVLSIAPRQIFEDIYVPLLADQLADSSPESRPAPNSSTPPRKKQMHRHNEPLPAITFNLPLPRKSPQPERVLAKLATGH